jgi:small subunit ribosomal protein S5
MDQNRDRNQGEFLEKLVKLNRVAKVVKGGRRFSFSALTVVGDRAGRVGYGFGKANDVSDAIRKSIDKAKRSMVRIPIKKTTLPHQVIGKFKSAQVLLKPAAPGTGVIAGGPIRAVMEAAGVDARKFHKPAWYCLARMNNRTHRKPLPRRPLRQFRTAGRNSAAGERHDAQADRGADRKIAQRVG